MSPLDKPTRREFLVATSFVALGAAVPLGGKRLDSPAAESPSTSVSEALAYPSEELFASGLQRTFTGDRAVQIAMPLGGIGAGCICLNGYGGLQDFSIRNHPSTNALPGPAFSIMTSFDPGTSLLSSIFVVVKIMISS
jgi:hypothetical protein